LPELLPILLDQRHQLRREPGLEFAQRDGLELGHPEPPWLPDSKIGVPLTPIVSATAYSIVFTPTIPAAPFPSRTPPQRVVAEPLRHASSSGPVVHVPTR